MKVTKIEFLDEIRDIKNNNVYVSVETENGYSYTISVPTIS